MVYGLMTILLRYKTARNVLEPNYQDSKTLALYLYGAYDVGWISARMQQKNADGRSLKFIVINNGYKKKYDYKKSCV